jgi:endonuclease/exonuclease/phosphatase family metal-dependent hydrolase
MKNRSLKVITYNIHKGLCARNKKCILEKVKAEFNQLNTDFILLQEVQGNGSKIKKEIKNRIKKPQHEFLAGNKWPYFQYGKNAVYQTGDHGNAILSKYPIIKSENFDISTNTMEKRGLLHTVIEVNSKNQLHIFNTHLNLGKKGRLLQIQKIIDLIDQKTKPKDKVILAGDFNEKFYRISPILEKEKFFDAHFQIHQTQAKTYPSIFPFLPLDRIYLKNCKTLKSQALTKKPWSNLSDHLPIMTSFKI